MAPYIISAVFVLSVVALCFARPNAGRIFLGFFFLVMALGVNGSFTFGNPQSYVEYAGGALIPFYRDLALWAVGLLGARFFGLLLMTFEIVMALLLLNKGRLVKIGLIGTMAFVIGIAPLSWVQLVWLGLVAGQVYLLRHEFETTFWEMLRLKLRRQPAR